MAERVRITDVSPRDGLQNEPGIIPTSEKVRLIELLCATGVDEVEVTSFVSAKWVPQLGDAKQLLLGVYAGRDHALGTADIPGYPSTDDVRRSIDRSPVLSALVPNSKGMDDFADAAGFDGRFMVEKVSVFAAASESFSKRNINATIEESVQRFVPVVERAKSYRLTVRGYVSCAVACPFEGPIAPAKVADVAARLVQIGVDEIDLGDTIGAGTPESVGAMLDAVRRTLGRDWWGPEKMTLHLHDTFGRAAECVETALQVGVRSFDGSVSGLGGCPYASTPGKRAPGNIATETLVHTIEKAGYTTGVNWNRLTEAADYAREIVAKSRSAGAGA
jgi:hydroxymethylglutaryl-CoA lyase